MGELGWLIEGLCGLVEGLCSLIEGLCRLIEGSCSAAFAASALTAVVSGRKPQIFHLFRGYFTKKRKISGRKLGAIEGNTLA
ncbi:MAG: hypothetical protein WA700_14450, partial [Acidobacteriaceae bacterium]